MTDAAFVEAIEACTLPRAEFNHRNHVRLAWIYLQQDAPAIADRRIEETILRYATSLGAAGKYRQDITLGWMRRVEAALRDTPAGDFDTFITAHPDLLSSRT